MVRPVSVIVTLETVAPVDGFNSRKRALLRSTE
jgi:hypothetical protein